MSLIPDGLPEDLPLTTGAELADKIRGLCLSTSLRLGEILGALEVAKFLIWNESQDDDWIQAKD